MEVYLDAWSSGLALYGRPRRPDDPGFTHNASSTFRDLQGNLTQDSDWSFRVADNITFAGESADTVFWYNYNNFANAGRWGFGFPDEDDNLPPSFWHNASAGWDDKRVGVFLSRHRKGPGEVPASEKMMAYNDSEVVVGCVQSEPC